MTTQIADPLVQALCNNDLESASWNSRSPSNLRIGNRLRTRRISYGISKKELSAQLGIDQDNLDLYETGAKRVNARLLLRIAKLLDVRPDYFFQDYASGEYEIA
jgi:DNA-binding Xre family transcriptional regulator